MNEKGQRARPPISTPRKGEDPVIPELVKHFKSLQTKELKQTNGSINKENGC